MVGQACRPSQEVVGQAFDRSLKAAARDFSRTLETLCRVTYSYQRYFAVFPFRGRY